MQYGGISFHRNRYLLLLVTTRVVTEMVMYNNYGTRSMKMTMDIFTSHVQNLARDHSFRSSS